jgi:molecular chaperone GrpE
MSESTDSTADYRQDAAAPLEPAIEIQQLQEALEALRTQLATAEAGAAAARDAHVRALAEAENVRKRAEREVDNARKYGAERVLGDLLAVCDSLELGLKAAAAPEATAKAIADGMELTQKQLQSFLEKNSVTLIDPVGQPFDPAYHEAVSMLVSTDVAANHVLNVMQKGYRLHDRLLRPAMVIVAKAPA